jgi:hypothetical protein
MNCLVTEGKMEGLKRRGRIRKQLLACHKGERGYWNFKKKKKKGKIKEKKLKRKILEFENEITTLHCL